MDDEAFYESVALELERDGPRKGLWAKAFAKTGGNNDAAKALYIEFRVTELKEVIVRKAEEERRQRDEAAREIKNAASFVRVAQELRNVGLTEDDIRENLVSRGLMAPLAERIARQVSPSNEVANGEGQFTLSASTVESPQPARQPSQSLSLGSLDGQTSMGGGMNDKIKTNAWWPDVSTPTAARAARMYGVWAALFSAVVTALLASWSLGSGRPALEFVDAAAFIDVVIFTAIAFGIYKESRFAAVSGFIIFLGEKLYQISVTTTTSGIVMAFILGMCYVAAIRGTYALSRFRAAQAAV